MLSFMIAVGENNEMGLNNRLPWHLPREIRYFRQVTEFHTIIMGRKTFESLPRVLPNREHIVLTRDTAFTMDAPEVTIVHTLDAALAITKGNEEHFVIGGAEIFSMFYPYTDRIYLTIIHQSFKADTFFMKLNWKEWQISKKWEGELDETTTIPHTYYVLDRVVLNDGQQEQNKN